MEWIKLLTDYYRDKAVAVGSDAQEVMFTRGLALAGELEESGFIPDALVHHLTRRPTQAKRLAGSLVKADLWERVPGGYSIVSWEEHQTELERYVERKQRDRDRKRRKRATSGGQSEDVSADNSADSLLRGEVEEEVDTAAAAAAVIDPVLDVLRSKLQEHTRLQGLRFDALRPDDAAELVALVEMHGDQRLVDVARDTCRTPTPVHVGAFLNTWRTLPPPGQRLAAVTPRARCDTHDWITLTSGGVCTACASEAIEAKTGATP